MNPNKNKTINIPLENQRKNITYNQDNLRSIKIKSYYRNGGKKFKNQANLPWTFSLIRETKIKAKNAIRI